MGQEELYQRLAPEWQQKIDVANDVTKCFSLNMGNAYNQPIDGLDEYDALFGFDGSGTPMTILLRGIDENPYHMYVCGGGAHEKLIEMMEAFGLEINEDDYEVVPSEAEIYKGSNVRVIRDVKFDGAPLEFIGLAKSPDPFTDSNGYYMGYKHVCSPQPEDEKTTDETPNININVTDGVVTGGIHIHNGSPDKPPRRQTKDDSRRYDNYDWEEPTTNNPALPWGDGYSYEAARNMQIRKGQAHPDSFLIASLVWDGLEGKLNSKHRHVYRNIPVPYWSHGSEDNTYDGWTWTGQKVRVTVDAMKYPDKIFLEVWEGDESVAQAEKRDCDKEFEIPVTGEMEGHAEVTVCLKDYDGFGIPVEFLPDEVCEYFWGRTYENMIEDVQKVHFPPVLDLPVPRKGIVPLSMHYLDIRYPSDKKDRFAGSLGIKPRV